MNKTVQKLVYQYLDNTYKLDLSTLVDYKVMLRTENKTVSIGVMYDDVKEMFSLHPYNCGEYFDTWIDAAALRLNNEAVDDLYNTYATARTTPINTQINFPNAKAMRLRAIVETTPSLIHD